MLSCRAVSQEGFLPPGEEDKLRRARGIRYLTLDKDTHDAIMQTCARLPDDVFNFVRCKCTLVSLGKTTWGQTYRTCSLGETAEWLILLDDRVSAADLPSSIAHEVAHAYRGHSSGSEQEEQEARDLARSWGLEGLGTLP